VHRGQKKYVRLAVTGMMVACVNGRGVSLWSFRFEEGLPLGVLGEPF
jgi:hypothetical protein